MKKTMNERLTGNKIDYRTKMSADEIKSYRQEVTENQEAMRLRTISERKVKDEILAGMKPKKKSLLAKLFGMVA